MTLARDPETTRRDLTIVRGACPHDCPDTCAMLYHVEDGRLVDVTGDPEHPMTRGGLCVKLKDFPEHHYQADRLLHPMRRVGPKGAGEFERITWGEALDDIRARWTDIIAEHGPQAIMPHAYLGHQGVINGLTAGDAFFNRLGATVAEKTYCESGSSTAWHMTVGGTGGLDIESMAYAKYIVVWGMNMTSTNLHGWPFLLEARRKGAKIVVIDPVRTRTARQADWHIRIRPGTDGALAMGLIHEIVVQGLVDTDYVERHTVGFDELAERAVHYPPERVEEITGVPAEDVRVLAREYATTQPAAIRQGVAIERSRGGGQAIRAITCLPALVGAWRYVGGGTMEMPIWEFPTKFDAICMPQWIPEGTRVINELDLGMALTGEMELDPPIRSLFVYNSNPVSQGPAQAKTMAGLMRDDLFTVVSDHFVNDTAKFADLVLPATMQAEQLDIMVTWGHLYISLNQPAIDPPGECVPNSELFRRLARTMGFTDDYWDRTDEQMLRDFHDWDAPALRGITYDSLKETGWARLDVGLPHERAPHAEGNFPTPSGKCEFRSSLAEGGNFVVPVWRSMYEAMQPGDELDPLPDYVPPFESPGSAPELAKRYPLSIVSPKPHAFLNSQYANAESKQRAQGDQRVWIHPEDAAERGIVDGEIVRVFNDRGQFSGPAVLDDVVMKGLVMAHVGHWQDKASGCTVNSITADRHNQLGNAGVYSDNLVEVERVATDLTQTPPAGL
ncbi:molybdopterin-containing oxidoreductase family protein [Actinomycetospora cinnamomea]|uniref:Anaerobic selenocysteine-containing dehydrogenase n=1 Tax=Actinomycetospora cinnamomea TaxID=663609 RepID=A0A2U1FFG6_9PSEU|nr:molybdopterin-dependent oxidoreductase [Actinomycetospora cinnamomea]PVZ10933.1 anaerobic selenocysteine-containing dehydrogenase [Actinomycetospora cinnamomea]